MVQIHAMVRPGIDDAVIGGCDHKCIGTFDAINELGEGCVDFPKVIRYFCATYAFFMRHSVELWPIGVNIFTIGVSPYDVSGNRKTLREVVVGSGLGSAAMCQAIVGEGYVAWCDYVAIYIQ